MKRLFCALSALIFATCVLAGCRSTAIKPSLAAQVPAQFVTAPKVLNEQASSLVTFTRDAGGTPHSRWIIYYDSKPVVRIGKGESVTMHVASGQHIFGIEPDAKIKVLQVVNVSQLLLPGRRYFFRAMFTGQGYRLQQTGSSGDIR